MPGLEGENVFIVGACKELGAWNPAEALEVDSSSYCKPYTTPPARRAHNQDQGPPDTPNFCSAQNQGPDPKPWNDLHSR